MAIQIQFKPIAEAIIKNIEKKDPEEPLFIIGSKIYKAKTLLIHFKREDAIAREVIQMALKANYSTKVKTLSPNDITPDVIEKTIKMFA